jgi:chemotaxis protein CheD
VTRHRQTEVFLRPGQHFVGDASYRIRTLLGSCVSITLWSPKQHIGSMSHFLLSTRGAESEGELDGRFAHEAMSLMLRDLARAGVAAQQCEAKLFGGGNMFPKHGRGLGLSVGQRNGEYARRLVSACGIRIAAESLFGIGYRQVIFDIATGHVWSRLMKPVDPSPKESA